MRNTTKLWTAILEATGRCDGDSPDVHGAYVRGVVVSSSQERAIDLWRRGLISIGFDFKEASEIEQVVWPFESEDDENGEIAILCNRALITRLPEYGAFYTWESDNESAE